MKMILTNFKNSIIATIVFAIVLCGIYPLIVTELRNFFSHAANGSSIEGIRIASWLARSCSAKCSTPPNTFIPDRRRPALAMTQPTQAGPIWDRLRRS